MKAKILVAFFLIGVFYSTQIFGQSKKYYIDTKGKIRDELSYKELKEQSLNALKNISKSMDVYEELTEAYNRNDSIVFSYKWYFSDNIEKLRKEHEKKKALIGKEFPLQSTETFDGRTISIDDLKGKPTLINLWFTGCVVCVEEMPALNTMQAEHGNRFNFLAITFESKAKVKKFLKKFKFDFQHIVNSKELTTKLGIGGFPVNLFLDKNGVLRVIEGNLPYKKNSSGKHEITDGAKFIEILEKLL